MGQLFQFLYYYRAFFLFLGLELLSFWLLIRTNPYHSSAYFHSSNAISGTIFQTKSDIHSYFELKEVNKNLAEDNAGLRELISRKDQPVLYSVQQDSAKIPDIAYAYDYIAARVINNSTRNIHNFLTINKGKKHGIEPGMGVISDQGVVGKVMSVSNNFATIASLLNTEMYVSSSMKSNGTFCTTNWNGSDPLTSGLLYVPRHLQLFANDSIVTSGFNSVFPPDLLIGTIKSFEIESNATFYKVDIKLANDFYAMSYVYVINNPHREEQSIIEQQMTEDE